MCTITLDRAVADGNNGTTIKHIHVYGTVIGCSESPSPTPNFPPLIDIDVHLLLINGQPPPPPDEEISNVWTASFLAASEPAVQYWHTYSKMHPPFPCELTIRLRAVCRTNPDCFDERDFSFTCCPAVTLSADVASECIDEKRAVTFSLAISGLQEDSPVFGTLHLGSGVGGSGELPVMFDPISPGPEWTIETNGSITGRFTFDYLPGRYDDVSFEMLFPSACDVVAPLSGGALEIGACSAADCPDDSDVVMVVTGGSQIFPVGENDPCLPAGDYVVTATQPDPVGRSYRWRVNEQDVAGENVNGINRNSFSLPVSAESTTVSVSVSTLNCAEAAEGKVVLRACDDDNDDNDETPENVNAGLDFCLVWFWINIVLMILVGIGILVALCSSIVTATNLVIFGIILGLAIITLISFVLWLWLCASQRTDACELIKTITDILAFLIAISVLIIISFAIAQMLGCAIAGAIDVAWFGTLMSITWGAGKVLGCEFENAD